MRHRVKITGIGPVTPAGIGRENFFRGINENKSRVRAVTRFDPNAGDFVAAEIPDFKMEDWIDIHASSKRLPRQTQFALAGAALALKDAGLSIADLADRNPVIVIGSALMDPLLLNRTIAGVAMKGPRAALPSVVFDAPPSAAGGRIAAFFETRCRMIALQSACCGGMDAIGHGAAMIASGQAEFVMCCGTEAPIYYQPMLELSIARLSPRNAEKPEEMGRPFDLWRNTGVIGEGACALILEPESSPRRAYAWIEGYAFGNDDEGAPGNGLSETIRMALANANHRESEVDLINAWGPGHPEIDRAEAVALSKVFGPALHRIPAVSIKGAIGNPIAAAGAIQVACTALSLSTGTVPPTVNWHTPDPECDLNLGTESRDLGCHVAVVNSHGLSGTNATIVMVRS